MKVIQAKSFTGQRAWDAAEIAEVQGATVRLHWTDRPYVWHKNDSDEIFVVLDGQINMFFRENRFERSCLLNPGDICHIDVGEEHVAHPFNGPARILVIEKKGSI